MEWAGRRIGATTMAPSDFKTRREIADLYGHIIPYSTLKKLSMKGAAGGPPVIRIGDRVHYHVPSFEAWLLQHQQGELPQATMPAARRKRGRPTKAEVVQRRSNDGERSADPSSPR